MKARWLLAVCIAASLAAHGLVLILVRFEAPEEVLVTQRVLVSLRRVVIAPPKPPQTPPPQPPRPTSPPPPPAPIPDLPPETAEPEVDETPEAPEDSPPVLEADLDAGIPATSAPEAPALQVEQAPSRQAATSMTPETTVSAAPERDRILSELRSLILEQIVYPPLARRRGIEGRVVLRLRLGVDGEAKALGVSQSSGYAVLDRAAVELVSGVLPLARGPSQPLTLEIPIVYGLTR